MEYLIVLLLCFLATAKVCVQTNFGKTSIKNTTDVLAFNACTFLVSAAIFSYRITDCPPAVWVYALVGAVSSTLFQLTYTKALTIGNVSLTILLSNMSLIINVLVSFFFYGDSMSLLRFIGILMTIFAFLLSVNVTGSQKATQYKKWLVLAVLTMLTNASGSIVMKVLGESQYSSYNREYVSAMYIISAILAFSAYLICNKKVEKKNFKFDKRLAIHAAGTGVFLAIYMVLNSYSLSVIEGTFLFPAISGGCVAFGALSGVILFKDKLNTRQVLSIIFGIAAIVLMNF